MLRPSRRVARPGPAPNLGGLPAGWSEKRFLARVMADFHLRRPRVHGENVSDRLARDLLFFCEAIQA